MPFLNYYLGVQCNGQELLAQIWVVYLPENIPRALVCLHSVNPREHLFFALTSHVTQSTTSIAPYTSPVL